jgi:hypothetical protein
MPTLQPTEVLKTFISGRLATPGGAVGSSGRISLFARQPGPYSPFLLFLCFCFFLHFFLAFLFFFLAHLFLAFFDFL